MVRIRNPQDATASLVLIVFSLALFWFGADLDIGTATDMGPGFLPRILAALILVLGAVIGVRSLGIEGPSVGMPKLRPFILIPLAVLAFGILLERAGLAAASFVSIVLAAASARDIKPLEAVLFGALMSAFVVIVFVTLLRMPIEVWP